MGVTPQRFQSYLGQTDKTNARKCHTSFSWEKNDRTRPLPLSTGQNFLAKKIPAMLAGATSPGVLACLAVDAGENAVMDNSGVTFAKIYVCICVSGVAGCLLKLSNSQNCRIDAVETRSSAQGNYSAKSLASNVADSSLSSITSMGVWG